MVFRVLLFCLVGSVFSACFKTNDIDSKGLPPLTTEGKNTFACYLNGVPWKEGFPGINVGGPTLEPRFYTHVTSWGDSILSIRAFYYYDNDKIHVDIFRLRVRPSSTGVLPILIGKEPFTRFFTEYQKYPTCIYDIDTTKVHEVNLVRFDLQERIASGTFKLTLYNTTACNDTLVITDGRFDVQFLIE